jgi:AcrR family transcriptional regulator
MRTRTAARRNAEQAEPAHSVPATLDSHRSDRTAAVKTRRLASVAAKAKVGQPKKRTKLTRAQKAALVRENILRAAAEVVGEFGYQDASIARITQVAGIAQGTFYLYFETRQHLFDELLPHAGEDMIKFIGERVHGATSYYDVEERGLRAFFEYVEEHPGFYRLLNEAEFAAPAAHKKHFEQLVEHYTASLRRSVKTGEIAKFSDEELEIIAYFGMAARSYAYLGYVKYGTGRKRPPESVIKTYMRLIAGGFKQ